jgi:hypothetical protein
MKFRRFTEIEVYRVHNSPPLKTILCKINPIQTLKLYFKLNFNILSMPRSLSSRITSGLTTRWILKSHYFMRRRMWLVYVCVAMGQYVISKYVKIMYFNLTPTVDSQHVPKGMISFTRHVSNDCIMVNSAMCQTTTTGRGINTCFR